MNVKKVFSKYYKYFYFVLLIVIAFICFFKLGNSNIADWDEARHGVSGYEMYKNGEYIVNTYNYKKDYWNLKPPISFQIIALNFKLFGVSIFTFRMYSAISFIILSVIVSIFILKRYGKIESLCSLFLLASCRLFFGPHMVRSGDADSIAMLFFTIAMIAMLSIKNNKKMIYCSGFFFALNFLTKSFHALPIAVIGGLYLVFTGYIKKFKIKEWIMFILSFMIPIGTWAILRYVKDGTKFFTEMVRYDLLKRASTGIEGHYKEFTYYFKYLILTNKIQVVAIFLIFVLFIYGIYKNKNVIFEKDEFIGYALWILVPLLLFSIAKSKLDWYVIPIMVPITMVAAIVLGNVIKNSSKGINFKNIVVICVILANVISCGKNVMGVIKSEEYPNQKFIKDQVTQVENIKGQNAYVCLDIEGYDDCNKWTQSMLLSAEINMDFKCFDGGIDSFVKDKNNSVLITNQDKLEEYKENNKDFKENIIKKQGQYLLLTN